MKLSFSIYVASFVAMAAAKNIVNLADLKAAVNSEVEGLASRDTDAIPVKRDTSDDSVDAYILKRDDTDDSVDAYILKRDDTVDEYPLKRDDTVDEYPLKRDDTVDEYPLKRDTVDDDSVDAYILKRDDTVDEYPLKRDDTDDSVDAYILKRDDTVDEYPLKRDDTDDSVDAYILKRDDTVDEYALKRDTEDDSVDGYAVKRGDNVHIVDYYPLKREAKNVFNFADYKVTSGKRSDVTTFDMSSMYHDLSGNPKSSDSVYFVIPSKNCHENLLQSVLPTIPSISIISGYLRDNSELAQRTESSNNFMVLIAPTDKAIESKLGGKKPWEFPREVNDDADAESNINDFLSHHVISDFTGELDVDHTKNLISNKLDDGSSMKIKQENEIFSVEINNSGNWIPVENVKQVNNGLVLVINDVLVRA